jgi:hypothetical protein
MDMLTPSDITATDGVVEATFYDGNDYANPLPASSGIYFYPGETVTVYVSVKINDVMFYYVLTVFRPQIITPIIHRRVELPAGFRTTPGAGAHYVNSGKDFVFYMPVDVVPDGHVLHVTTDRASDDEGGITVKLTDDGRYEVRIRAIREDIVIAISFTDMTNVGNVAVAASKVWSSSGTLHIVSALSGDAYIYNVSGVLVKIQRCTAGETTQTALARGYILLLWTDLVGKWLLIS